VAEFQQLQQEGTSSVCPVRQPRMHSEEDKDGENVQPQILVSSGI